MICIKNFKTRKCLSLLLSLSLLICLMGSLPQPVMLGSVFPSALAQEKPSDALNEQNIYLDAVAQLFAANDYYPDWTLEAKKAWMKALSLYSFDPDAGTAANLLSSDHLSDAQLQIAIDSFVTGRYGTIEYPNHVNLESVLVDVWGDNMLWSLEQGYQYWDYIYKYRTNDMWDVTMAFMPDAAAITPQQAIDIAWAAVAAAYDYPEDITATEVIANVMFGIGRTYAPDYPPYYSVTFGLANQNPGPDQPAIRAMHSCYVTQNGQVMDSAYFAASLSPAEEAAELQTHFEKIPYGFHFGALTLHEKAAFTDRWYDDTRAYLAQNPDYRGMYYYETLHRYGLPSANHVTQSTAEVTAQKAAATLLHATDDYVSRAGTRTYFDVTNESNPLWKVYLSTHFGVNTVYGDSLGYFIIIDANTGNVLDTYECDGSRPYEDFR